MGEPVNSIRRCFNEISDVYRTLIQNLEFLQACEHEFIRSVEETTNRNLRSEKAEAVTSILNIELGLIVERNAGLQQKLAQIKSLVKRKIPYIPCGLQPIIFKYISGNSPWCFWLQITTVISTELLHRSLLEKYENNQLKKLCSLPDVGDYVCYVERDRVFRGKVLLLLEDDRVKLRDVDTSCVRRVHQEQIYEIDSTTCNVHALAVNCCLSKNFEDEKMWSKDLGEIFKDVLANGTLCLDIQEQLNDAGVFLVNVYVIDKDKNFVDLHEWVIQRIIPELRDMCDKGLEADADYLSPKALDAFFPVINIPADMTDPSSCETVPSTQYISGKNYHVNLKKPNTVWKKGEEIKVILSYAVSPWKFYANFANENNTHIDELRVNMTEYYSAYMDHAFRACPWFILKALFGKFCACCWNDYWYRVEVLNWNVDERASVFFLDYGNKADVLLSALWPLFVEFTKYDMMAQRCHLSGVVPVYPENKLLPRTVKQRFFSLLDFDIEKLCTITVVFEDYTRDSLGIIIFRENGSTVNNILLMEGYGREPKRTLNVQKKASCGSQVIKRKYK